MKHKPTPLTRAELIQEVRERLSLSGREAGQILETILECIAESLEQNGLVSLSGLGRFQVKETPARPGRNPKTGIAAVVPAKHRPTFTMSRTLRSKMLDNLKHGFFEGTETADDESSQTKL